ncbi:unnamed protein product [Polarella glacialis]|uniref:Uncharacterized protein n=1 Tax=Polarella glacialis TaxID=89957 RepID=A0A813INP2_POLGL|nr:unnamed protein product [Polarella glacialis]
MSWGCCCAPAPAGEAEKVLSSSPVISRGAEKGEPRGVTPLSPIQPATPVSAAPSAAQGGLKMLDLVGAATVGSGGGRPASAGQQQKGDHGGQSDADNVDTASMASSRSAKSMGTQSSVCSEFIQERMPASKIQAEMKTFVRSMVRGRSMGAVSPDGQLRTCSCSLDKRLKHFVIEIKGSVRRIGLSEISEVYQGQEPEDIDTPLDELCSTLMLESGECISFHFPDVVQREHFAMCLQILVDGQQ